MATFLFDKIVFGPVSSRRLGVSLGINLLPLSKKLCNFDCIYCECGWSHLQKIRPGELPSRKEVFIALENKLTEMLKEGPIPDVITFAGNGEPTMHPDFNGIVKDTVILRDRFFPDCKISLLCNSTLIHKEKIREVLPLIDQNIFKLDTAIEYTFIRLNKPAPGISLSSIIENLTAWEEPIILQTLLIKGKDEYSDIDNTTEEEINALIRAYHEIDPASIMIYTFERDTPTHKLIRPGKETLLATGQRLLEEGFKVEVIL